MSRSREEAIRLGYKVYPIKHRKTRRALWHEYWKAGEYGITIHIFEDEDGGVERCMLLSRIEGEAEDAHVVLTDLGRLVDQKLRELGTHRREEGISLGAYVLMPTHIHMTLTLAHDLPRYMYNGSERYWTISDVLRGFEKGCTSWWWRYLEGEDVDDIIANPIRRRAKSTPPSLKCTPPSLEGNKPAPSLWHKDGFNDLVLYKQDRKDGWKKYVNRNAYYWRLRELYPKLFEHRLHLMMAGADYTAYGCMFLLERAGKVQVLCHRLARKNMLTEREWLLATQSMTVIKAYENDARKKHLGHFDWDWTTSTNPETITPIDYTRTEAFRKQKADLLRQCEEEHAVLTSPAVSAGEQNIFYIALEMGFPCIKLVKDPIPEKGHANDKDRDFCAKGQLVVLGPWKIKERAITNGSIKTLPTMEACSSTSDDNINTSLYARFHNLNDMAADLCKMDMDVNFDSAELEQCR